MDFVFLQSFDNYIDAHIVLGRMQHDGIKCWLKDENTVTINPIFAGAVGGIKLMVAEEQLPEASLLLTRIYQEKKSKQACPHCSSHDIELVTSKKPFNLLGVVASWLTASYAVSAMSSWHCFTCGRNFEQPLENEAPWDENSQSDQ